MKILYVAMRYDYGAPSRGESFEHYNFYEPLRDMGHDILYFDFMTLLQARGRRWMNRRLFDVCHSEKPDVLFCVLFKEELEKETIQEISAHSDTVTVNWFADDHWRFENFSRHWAPHFNHVVTTASSALPKYAEIGYQGVIKSQWGCNHLRYRPLEVRREYDVTFVGQPHGDRREVVEKIRREGIDVQVWGAGWESGRLSQDEMVRVFSASKIVLNLSNASVLNAGRLARIKSGADARIKRRLGRAVPHRTDGSALGVPRYHEQIKGRNFEVPGCRAFLLTGEADNLGEYYEVGREVVTFSGVDHMIEKIRRYLRDETEREAVAESGLRRTLDEHTYFHRFRDIFASMSVPASYGEDGARPGETISIE
ncbi:MAG: glycosyltransferase [Actinomycetota bacterium]|nr:glycosyltransferase [Actinomycetota bacterium]